MTSSSSQPTVPTAATTNPAPGPPSANATVNPPRSGLPKQKPTRPALSTRDRVSPSGDEGARGATSSEKAPQIGSWTRSNSRTAVKPDAAAEPQTLQRGIGLGVAHGDDNVRQMQQHLIDLGFKLPKFGADGKFGPETEAALRQFQQKNGLQANGIAASDTLNALGKAHPQPQGPRSTGPAQRGRATHRGAADPRTQSPGDFSTADVQQAVHGGLADRLGSVAPRNACNFGKHHLCYHGVKASLSQVGIHVEGGSAYQAASQLANNPRVQELHGISANQLPRLPKGAIVVWNRGPGHPDGHISIASGNGIEYSDRPRRQITHYGTGFRVFMPVG